MLADGEASITDVDRHGRTALLAAAIGFESLPTLIWLLKAGGACVTDRDHQRISALLAAAIFGRMATCQWLLEHGGADITDRDYDGCSALLLAASSGRFALCQWLLEHSGANIADEDAEGDTIWIMLEHNLATVRLATELTALLRVMVLRSNPPDELVALMRSEHVQVVEDGARLRVALPAYLGQRRALLDAHCPLIAPLRDLVRGYDDPEPITTDEIWATGLGAAP
jgi:hypothetical protein